MSSTGKRNLGELFTSRFGELLAPIDKQRQVGKTGLEPSLPVEAKYPPQAIENKKIRSVPIW